MDSALVTGGTQPFRESIERTLAESGISIGEPFSLGTGDRVAEVLITAGPPPWDGMAFSTRDHGRITVVVVDALAPEAYIEALAAGADGVVYADSSSETICDVIHAALGGTVVLPTGLAHVLAQRLAGTAPLDLNEWEVGVLQSIVSGVSIVDLARAHAFSERTMRRKVHSVYAKIGAHNRSEAVHLATKSGIVSP